MDVVRKAGGLFIADEVQPGFGRNGYRFWGHQRIGVQPDIVTMGKPMGKRTSRGGRCHKRRDHGRVSTFLSLLQYLWRQSGFLCSCVGGPGRSGRRKSAGKRPPGRRTCQSRASGTCKETPPPSAMSGGCGLFFGAEMVTDRATKAPASEYVVRVVNEMRARGVLMNKLGIHYNTLKLRPPMPFSIDNSEQMLETLDHVLSDLGPADE